MYIIVLLGGSRVMISGRCSLLSTIRYVSEVSKKRFSYNRQKSNSVIINFYNAFDRHQTRLAWNPSQLIPPSTRMSSSTSKGSRNEIHSTVSSKNRLALERSPYLLQHATNPVEWYPWGQEAFDKAIKENKPIFLSVGYSTCHWCHVMEHESFENPDIAMIMNRYFVNIKVDREERPDVDRIYMTFVQSMSGHGGWPMSVFLTPDLKPITGGTYFPPEQKYGVPGFKNILITVAEKWAENKNELIHIGSEILKALKHSAEVELPTGNSIPSLTSAEKCAHQLIKRYDPEFGGFSSAPKFPQPVNFNFLFHMYSRNPKGDVEQECLDACVNTLKMIANGGIHDHIGQGFSRYSVDGRWHVPHFEKMLYDQAQLLRSYADAFVATKDIFFAEIVDDIVTYVKRDLRHKEGGFYSAEDADSYPDTNSTKKKEGAFYVWSYDELKSHLSKQIPSPKDTTLFDIFCYHYNATKEGNVPRNQDPHGELSGKNILYVKNDVDDTATFFGLSTDDTKNYLNDARKILFEERSKRPRPHLDDKFLAAWNGLMISGLARAGAAVDNGEYVNLAIDAAKFVEKYLMEGDSQTLLRSCYRGDGDAILQTSVPISAFHSDYAFMVKGLLDLYEACFDGHWLELAEKLQDLQDELFWDAEKGGYFTSASNDPTIILRLKDDHDGAEPSSNSIACENLFRLAVYLNRGEFKEKGARILQVYRQVLEEMPIAVPQLTSALLYYHDSIMQIHVVGKLGAEDTNALLRIIQQRLVPAKILVLVDHEQPTNVFLHKNEIVSKMIPLKGLATAYVCRHHTCSLPVNNPSDLAALLENEQKK